MGDNEEFNTRSSRSKRHQPLQFLPMELIFEILLWLPVRSLLLFKCVSKSWKTLISDPQFAKSHLKSLIVNTSIIHQRLIYNNVHGPPNFVSFPMTEFFKKPLISKPVEFTMEHEFCILGSCNGLMCLFDIDKGYVKLWNPSIRRLGSKKSPNLDRYDKRNFIKGFGYDHVNDKYKVLVVASRLGCNISEKLTRIYSFGGNNSWKTIKNFPSTFGENVATEEGKFVSGSLNWLIDISFRSNQHVILSFDLEKETFDEVLLPNYEGINESKPKLGVLNNCLCVYFNYNGTHWDIWLMKKYGVAESWTRLTTFPIEQLKQRIYHHPSSTRPLFIFENSIVLVSFTGYVVYNLDNGSFEYCLPSNFYHESRLATKHIYYESLVSP